MIPIGLHTLFTHRQMLSYNAWDKEQLKIAMHMQEVERPENLKIAKGTGLQTFSFTPIKDDFICEVKNNITGSILDLTNY